MPFIPASLSNDPFDLLGSRQRNNANTSSDVNAAEPPPPIHAAAIDINVGAGAREQSDLLSTPELSPEQPGRSDEADTKPGQHPEPSWSDDLFGSEADPSEVEVRRPLDYLIL